MKEWISAAKASGVVRGEGEWSRNEVIRQEILPRLKGKCSILSSAS